MNSRLTVSAVVAAFAVAIAAPAAAQDPGASLAQARDSIDVGSFEPALGLIDAVLKSTRALPRDVRLRAHILRGATLTLIGGREPEAVESFRQALQIDPDLNVDSLQSLSNQLLRVFGEAKDQLAAAARASLGDLEFTGLPETGIQLSVDDTIWRELRGKVLPGWRRIAITAEGYLPYRDSVLVDSGGSIVKDITLTRPPLDLTVDVPSDTALSPADPGLPVRMLAGRAARMSLTLVSADGIAVSTDTLAIATRGTFSINIRRSAAMGVAATRYILRAAAVDEWGVSAAPVEIALVVSRAAVDTAPTPQPPPASSFLPERVRTHPGPVAPALGSVALAALTVAVPSLLANRELGGWLTRRTVAVGVGGTIAIAGIVGFFSGSDLRPAPANVRQNAQRRSDYARALQETARANARLRDTAPILVRAERRGP